MVDDLKTRRKSFLFYSNNESKMTILDSVSSPSSRQQILIRAPSFEDPKTSQTLNIDEPARPVTARSLPSKCQPNERDFIRSNYLCDHYSGNVRKPSCPNMSQPQIKIINVNTKETKNDYYLNVKHECSNDIAHSRSSPSLSLLRRNSHSNTNTTNSSNTLQSHSKSNLDHFLDYSINPFTTKYELIGQNKLSTKPPLSTKKNDSNKNNMSLKETDDPNHVMRSQSIGNLNERKIRFTKSTKLSHQTTLSLIQKLLTIVRQLRPTFYK